MQIGLNGGRVLESFVSAREVRTYSAYRASNHLFQVCSTPQAASVAAIRGTTEE